MTLEELEAALRELIGDFAIEEVGAREELVIYTGLCAPSGTTLRALTAEEMRL